ncbi:MAG: MFS transporter [Chlamydiia bacterium]
MKTHFLNSIDKFFSLLPKLSIKKKKQPHSLWWLNLTQFFGVINDNLYKLLLVFLFIDILGLDQAASILSAAGIIYVLPFLLFSSTAGILADRFSKQKIICTLKGFEVFITALVIVGFYYKSLWGCYALLFFLASHSALFGPSKYGIISELVEKDSITKANGLITSFTYIAMIVGTFLASFLTDITHKDFLLTSYACFIIAVLGFISSFFIEKTPAQGSNKKVSFLFLREIYGTLQFCKGIVHLRLAIFGSAFFLFIGAFAQLNIIPFAMESLHFSEIAGGYLFLVLAIGIAIGSYLCGRSMKSKIHLGISCLAGLGLSLSLILLTDASFSLTATVIMLIVLGMAGGAFVIPLDSFIQINSPIEKRGQVIAATNFLSFIGVLLASITLFLLNSLLDLSPAWSFRMMGILTLITTSIFTCILFKTIIPPISKKLLCRLYKVRIANPNSFNEKKCLYILENATLLKVLLLIGIIPDIHVIAPKTDKKPFWYHWIPSIEEMEYCIDQEKLLENAKNRLAHHRHPCLVLSEEFCHRTESHFSIKTFFTKKPIKLIKISKNKERNTEIAIQEIS